MRDVDAVIVGGGPCGLTLAKGLLDLGYSVVVIEKEPCNFEGHDWSKAYSFRVDVRGLALLRRVGLFEEFTHSEESVKSEGFKGTRWMPNGIFVAVPPRTLGSVAYWIMRPKFIKILHSAIPEKHKIQGEASDIMFTDGSVSVSVNTGAAGSVNIRAKYLFGCDGIRSKVRESLVRNIDPSFETSKIDCLSAGLVFRAALYQPPESLDPNETYMIVGKSGERLAMLPFGGEPGKPRPIATSQRSDYLFFQQSSPEALYNLLEEEFPQLEVRTRLSPGAAQTWCDTKGSTFPRPRYAGKAGTVVDGAVAVLLGDALHSFPPDLGQGLNSGMVDVDRVLDLMRDLRDTKKDANKTRSLVEELSHELVEEAQSVCEILPIGMPYQYSFPLSFHKICFFTDFLTRITLHGLSRKLTSVTSGWVPVLITAPAILEIQDDPPKKYVTIMQNHRKTSWRLRVLLGTGCLAIAAGIWSRHRQP